MRATSRSCNAVTPNWFKSLAHLLFTAAPVLSRDMTEMILIAVIRPYYPVAINPNWLDNGGAVELCIGESVKFDGTAAPLKEEQDLLVKIDAARGMYELFV